MSTTVPTGKLHTHRDPAYSTVCLHAHEQAAGLSWRAVGLYTYLLTRPPGWRLRLADLVARHTEGRDAVRSALKELEEAGYLQRQPRRSAGGKVSGWEWHVFERPAEAPTVPLGTRPTENQGDGAHRPPGKPSDGSPGPVVNGRRVDEQIPPTVQDEPVPTAALVPAAEEKQRVSANKLLGAWIDAQPQPPPRGAVAKQGAAAKRLCEAYTREELAAAWVGMPLLYPHSEGEPWDLFDLERKFAKAAAKAHDHPELRARRREAELVARLDAVPDA